MPDADAGAVAVQPVILAVDDEPAVLRAIAGDLRRHYARRYRVVRAGSGEEALEVVAELRERGARLALVVSDQRMPGMGGVDLLAEVRRLEPDVKVVLLTAYADTEVAIEAINRVRLDYYVLKPWDPPEEQLFPVLDDLLDDWEAGAGAPVAGLQVIGYRWSPEAHELRDFLSRNLVPFRWLDVEGSPDEAARLLGGGSPRLPVVVTEAGQRIERATPATVAPAIGLRSTTRETRAWDLLILGAGPAGLAAAVYGASEGLRTGIVEQEAPGGQAGQSSRIENYLGFPAGLSGADLTRRAVAQARRLGAEFISPACAVRLERCDPYRVLHLTGGERLTTSAVVLATGVSYRRLNVPGMDELAGRGIYYGAARAEAPGLEGEDVVIVGGANSAGQAAVFLAGFARRVVVLVRGDDVAATMSAYLIDQIASIGNIEIWHRSQVAAVDGAGRLERVAVRRGDDPQPGETQTVELKVAAMFIFIGAEPRTDWLAGAVDRDPRGFILTGRAVPGGVRDPGRPERDRYLLETSVPGVFAVGDVRASSVKRVASAVGEGAIAVQFVHQYLSL
ncbi:MAG TPA: FAD-dependent oxidoreductase [Acidimicrobiia bacterium]|nr:FAD-dependent oxidoreductase [Acidimicrobiia bacterium]